MYKRLLINRHIVIPVKTGIHYLCGKWIPAFAGMTAKIELFGSFYNKITSIGIITIIFALFNFALFNVTKLSAEGPEAAADSTKCKECEDWKNLHPDWIFCDDFESDLPMKAEGRYFEYGDDGGDCVVLDSIGYHASKGIRVIFQPDEVGAGGFKLAFGRNPSNYMNSGISEDEDFREIYYRMYLKNQKGWEGNPAKLSRATVIANEGWAQAMIAHLWSDGKDHLLIDPASGIDDDGNLITTKYNDFENLRWLGNKSGVTPLFAAGYDDKWYCIEAHVKLNDAGAANGIQEFWIDNNYEAGSNNINFVGTYNAYAINAVFFENYWNDGSPKLQERYFDNIVVSRSKIGCGCSPLTISPPNMPDAETNKPYSNHLKAAGGFPPYDWQVSDGDLPPGISLNSSTGEVFGTAGQAGAFAFTVILRDSDVPARFDTAEAILNVTEPTSVANSSASDAINLEINSNSYDNKLTISFNLLHSASVNLAIFNSIGVKVDTVIDKFMESGSSQTAYFTGALSAGVYFYTFRTNEHINSGKFIIDN